jgi:hypothetical protein
MHNPTVPLEFSIRWTPLPRNSDTRTRTGWPADRPGGDRRRRSAYRIGRDTTEPAEAPMTLVYRVQRGSAS